MYIAKNIKKTYRVREKKNIFDFYSKKKEICAVKNISLSIEKGQIVGLLGINGAGKTTTMKMLTTMISPTSGAIEVDGINAVKNHSLVKKKINMITGGERNIYWRLTAKENLEYFGSLYGIEKKVLLPRIAELLKKFGLEEYDQLPVERYSKGMKQRLQIVRGLINEPEYIFLDEPTLGLDVMIAKELREYIKYLASEHKGVLLTTHYILEAEELCDYIYIIDKGQIVDEGTPAFICEKYTIDQEAVYFVNKKIDNTDFLLGIEETKTAIFDDEEYSLRVVSRKNNMLSIIKAINEVGIDVIKIESQEPSLEDSIIRAIYEKVEK